MASTGATPTQASKDAWAALKKRQLKWIVFKLAENDDTLIDVEDTNTAANFEDIPKGATEEEFEATASKNWNFFRTSVLGDTGTPRPRYAAYDFEFIKEGGRRNKIAFVMWNPDANKNPKMKMQYTSSLGALKMTLGVGNELSIQANSPDELEYEYIKSEL